MRSFIENGIAESELSRYLSTTRRHAFQDKVNLIIVAADSF